jgi:hypothetical protein
MTKFEKILRTGALHIGGALLVPIRLLGALTGFCRAKYMQKTDAKRMLKAIEWATLLAQKTGYRYIVLNIRGRYVVKPKRVLKHLINCKGKHFVRGTTVQDLEREAVFISK